MIEEVRYIASHLTGPTGGIFALGAAVGSTLCWVFFQRNILKIHTDAIERLQKSMDDSERECRIKIEKLECRIESLEMERLRLSEIAAVAIEINKLERGDVNV